MEGTTSRGSASVVTTIARPLVIIGGGVAMTLLLQALVGDDFGSGGIGDGLDDVLDALPVSIELAVLGTLLALVVAVPLGLAARSSAALERLVGVAAIYTSVWAPTVVVSTLFYWLAVRAGLSGFGWTPLSEDVGEHLEHLIIPVLVIAFTMALPLAAIVRDTVTPWRRRSLGLEAVAAPVAGRPFSSPTRLVGYPLGLLLLTLFAVEFTLGIPGVAGLTLQAIRFLDLGVLIAALLTIIVLGALGALVVDLVGLALRSSEPSPPMAPGAGPTGTTSSGTVPALVVGGLLLALFIVAAILGRVLGSPFDATGSPRAGILSDGYLLGSDRIGRSRLHLLAQAAGPLLLRCLLVSLIPTAVGVAAAAIGRSASAGARTIVGVAVDVFWWPMVPMLMLTSIAFEATGTFAVSILVVFSLGLLPVATRLAIREFTVAGVNPAGIGGVLVLVMGWAALIEITGGFFFTFEPASWSSLLTLEQQEMAFDATGAVVMGFATMLFLAALQLTGLGLLGLGRRSVPSPVIDLTTPVAAGVVVGGAGQPPAFPPPIVPPTEPPAQQPVAPPVDAARPAEAPVAAPPPTQPPVRAPADVSRQTVVVEPPMGPPVDAPITPAPPEPPARPPEG